MCAGKSKVKGKFLGLTLTSTVLSKGNGSLLCFAQFMEREIARLNRNKCHVCQWGLHEKLSKQLVI